MGFRRSRVESRAVAGRGARAAPTLALLNLSICLPRIDE